jgi:ABC-2 type transport system permease protein
MAVKLRRIKALAKKEFIQIIRDLRSLSMAIFIPILLLILFGYALTLDVDNVRIAVWDRDKSQVSSDFIRNLGSSRYFKIIGYYDDYDELSSLIDKNTALMAVVVPEDFSKLIRSNQPASVQLLIDGSDSSTATIALGYANSIVSRYNIKFVTQAFSKTDIEMSTPIDLRSRVWFNEELKSKNYIVPGLIAVIIMVIAALLTSLTVAREWERGTMEQLISTPITAIELILGKFLPYFVIGLLDLAIAVGMGQFMFHVPFRGSIILLFITSGLFLCGALMLGMFISSVAKNQLMASQMAMLATFLPGFLLSGFAYPINNMPEVIQAITLLVPARYFIRILRGIYLKGIGINVLWPDVLFLLMFTFIMVALASVKFKRKVA